MQVQLARSKDDFVLRDDFFDNSMLLDVHATRLTSLKAFTAPCNRQLGAVRNAVLFGMKLVQKFQIFSLGYLQLFSEKTATTFGLLLF